MTARILTIELTNLIQEAKKKSGLKKAAEKSLEDLKRLPVTSEAQLGADLRSRPHFVDPFILACRTHNAKLTGLALSCLQRLASFCGISKERLEDVLQALQEATALSSDVQLKLLQALPPLLQNYGINLSGELLVSLLQICSAVYSSKTAAVNSSAAATFQQLLAYTYDKVLSEDDRLPSLHEIDAEGDPLLLRPAAYDAYRIFSDLCLLAEAKKPQFLKSSHIPQVFALDLVGSLLLGHGEVFHRQPEQAYLLSKRVVPLVHTMLLSQLTFPMAVRAIRILHVSIQQHTDILDGGSAAILHLLNTLLDSAVEPWWKRMLSMEVLSKLFAAPRLILHLYAEPSEQGEARRAIRETLDSFVRISSENPHLTAAAQLSTVSGAQAGPTDASEEQAAMEAGGVAGLIAGTPTAVDTRPPGISTQWSSLKSPLMVQLDRSEAPCVPDTYIYSLVLSCISKFSEGLARFIMPLTVGSGGKDRKRSKSDKALEPNISGTSNQGKPSLGSLETEQSKTLLRRQQAVAVNPLQLEEHPEYADIQAAADIVNDCWPALLAVSYTFLNAELDAELYHDLVRSFQKFTQVAGVLRLATPRDALLTTLSKAVVPPNVLVKTSPIVTSTERTGTMFANMKGLLSTESLLSQTSNSSGQGTRGTQMRTERPILTSRNLLCLRALLNLAIALGPIFGGSWRIVFGTLQQAEQMISAAHPQIKGRVSTYAPGSSEEVEGLSEHERDLGTEIAAVESAVSRLLESTVTYSNEAFVDVLVALVDCVNQSIRTGENNPTPPAGAQRLGGHRRTPSRSTAGLSHNADETLLLAKLGQLTHINTARLVSNPPESGWEVLTETLISYASDKGYPGPVRLATAGVLEQLIIDTIEIAGAAVEKGRSDAQLRSLRTMQHLVICLRVPNPESDEAPVIESAVDQDVYKSTLDALRLVLERFGDQLIAGWESVFEMLRSVFRGLDSTSVRRNKNSIGNDSPISLSSQLLSEGLGRAAFGSLQLICSDFLSNIPLSSMPALIDALSQFCAQDVDMNMSLTTVNFFWNLIGHFQTEMENLRLVSLGEASITEQTLLSQLQSVDQDTSRFVLWLLSLIRLTQVTSDPRADVRNAAVQTVFSILSNVGDHLKPDDWDICLSSAVLLMIEINLDNLSRVHSVENDGTTALKSWTDTTRNIVGATATLILSNVDSIRQAPRFRDVWNTLMGFFEHYLHCKLYEVLEAVYSAISRLLSTFDADDAVATSSTDQVLSLLTDDIPLWNREKLEDTSIERVYLAYVQCLREVLRLSGHRINTKQLETIFRTLRQCAIASSSASYPTSNDRLTLLQSNILECINKIPLDTAGKTRLVVAIVAELIAFPYQCGEHTQSDGKVSFIAFSNASMDVLQDVVVNHANDEDLLSSGEIPVALRSLCQLLTARYPSTQNDKAPPIWQKATTCALAVIAAILPSMKNKSVGEAAQKELWTQLCQIVEAIAKPDSNLDHSNTTLIADESFDIDAFTSLRDLMLPHLYSASVPDTARDSYAHTLFSTSLIHSVGPGDIPEDIGQNPTLDLLKVRFGRTYDPSLNPRRHMAYLCLDELFNLVSIPPSEQERHEKETTLTSAQPDHRRLARISAPYLLVHAALPIKAYIADTPLRGRYMPFPQSQLTELVYVLRRMRDLDSLPGIFPSGTEETEGETGGGGTSDGNGGEDDGNSGTDAESGDDLLVQRKAHLLALLPLVSQALPIASWRKWEGDREVLKEVRAWLDVVRRGGEQ